jgi:hypothetical protein
MEGFYNTHHHVLRISGDDGHVDDRGYIQPNLLWLGEVYIQAL